MKMSPMIFVLGVLHVTWNVPVQAEPRFGVPEFPGERIHPGFVLAQGPSGDRQAALPRNTRDQGLIDGELAAGFKRTGSWFLAGYIAGVSLIGVVADIPPAARSSDAELSQEDYQSIQKKGTDYISGFREGYKKNLRTRRYQRTNEGVSWGVSTFLGLASMSAARKLGLIRYKYQQAVTGALIAGGVLWAFY